MRVVTFGEIMLRLSPPGHQRFLQAHTFEAGFGGAEANVAVALSQLGVAARFVSAVPSNDLGEACIRELRGWGVDTSFVLRGAGRMGIYFLEHGASQRPSNVIYDRAGSAISELDPAALDWDAILDGATWFHFSGITPALSENARQAVSEGAQAAKRLGATVSCDLNYRKKLWSREQAEATMSDLMEHVDVCLANEEDAESVFGVCAQGAHVEAGKIDPSKYRDVGRQLADRFGLRAVGISMRESHSASRNGWSGMLYANGRAFFSQRYEIDVVDRIGAGDAFAAGLIFGFQQRMDAQATIEFAAAAGCLAHSVPGDFGVFTHEEVENLLKGGGSGRVSR